MKARLAPDDIKHCYCLEVNKFGEGWIEQRCPFSETSRDSYACAGDCPHFFYFPNDPAGGEARVTLSCGGTLVTYYLETDGAPAMEGA